MKEGFVRLIRHRQVLLMLVLRDIRIKYKQSVMGFMWAILMPMVIVAAGVLVRKAFSMLSGEPMHFSQIASVSVKALPWSFFVASIRFATTSLTANINLVTKIYFPREVFPLSAVIANLVDFAVASCVLAVILAIGGMDASIYLCWLPLLLVVLILLAAGFAMLLACANLFFRDVKYLVEVILTFGIFFTPVFYEASMFKEWAPVLLLNPIAPLLEAINSVVVLQQAPDLLWLGYSALWAIIGFFVSWSIFHNTEHKFAESI